MDRFGRLPERVIAAILPETNLHVKSSIAAILPDCCSNIAAISCQKPCILVRENHFAYYIIKSLAVELKKKKKLSAVYCKLTFVAKNLIGPLSCDCKNACVFHSRQQIWRMC